MNRIWLGTIVGLLLGAILYGMLQSGRGADAEPAMGPRAGLDAPREQVAPTGATRTPSTRFPAPINEPRYLATDTPVEQYDPDASSATRERIRAEQRRLAAERRQRLQESAAGALGATTTMTDPRSRDDVRERLERLAQARARRAELTGRQAMQMTETQFADSMRADPVIPDGAGVDAAALQAGEAAAARDAFRDSLADSGTAPGDRRPNAADAEAPVAERGFGDDSNTRDQNQPPAGAPMGAVVGIGIGSGASSGGGTGNNGGGSNNGGSSGGGTGNNGGSTGGNSGGGNTGGSGGGTNPPPPPPPPPPPIPTPITLTAEWAPVERTSAGCDELRGTVTNDLWIRASKPILVLAVGQINVSVNGGRFVQVAGGGNAAPSAGAVSANPCLAFDSYLALGGATPQFPGGLDANGWGSALATTVFTTAIEPGRTTPGVSTPVQRGPFAAEAPRIRLGRFTVTGNPTAVTGQVLVTYINLETGLPGFAPAVAPITNQPALWATNESPAPVKPRLAELGFSSPTILAGKGVVLTVTLDQPAPSDVLVALLSNTPALRIPSSVTIPTGARSVTVIASTDPRLTVRIDAVLTAISAGVLLRASLTIDPRTPGDISGDGAIDGADLGRLLGAWGTDDPLADMNGDGKVDGADLGLLLGAWTPAPTTPGAGDVIARWIPVTIPTECATGLAGQRSGDLYLGFQTPINARATIMRSGAADGLRVAGGAFYQAAGFLNSNGPPSAGALAVDPCTRFDSYVTLANAAPIFTPGGEPDLDWGASLVAEWFTTSFDFIQVEQNLSKFGDTRYYLRVGRFTAPVGTGVSGTMGVIYSPQSGSQKSAAVIVPNDPNVWGNLDLNNDGLIDAADVELMTGLLGAEAPQADLDGNGAVDAADLRIMLDAAARAGA